MTNKIKLKVEELFKNAPDRHQRFRVNPVTGGSFVAGLDPIRPQKLIAERALEAQEWYASQKPPDAPTLPLKKFEREKLKGKQPIDYIVSLFGRSLACWDYHLDGHPDFEPYVRGVMASSLIPDFIRNDHDLLQRYPPRPLKGLGNGLIWRNP